MVELPVVGPHWSVLLLPPPSPPQALAISIATPSSIVWRTTRLFRLSGTEVMVIASQGLVAVSPRNVFDPGAKSR
jgi:hypothetical protein